MREEVDLIRSLNEGGETRDPWLRVRVFRGSEFLYPYPYPWKNPRKTHGYTCTRDVHYA
jgi:hypothetical protein